MKSTLTTIVFGTVSLLLALLPLCSAEPACTVTSYCFSRHAGTAPFLIGSISIVAALAALFCVRWKKLRICGLLATMSVVGLVCWSALHLAVVTAQPFQNAILLPFAGQAPSLAFLAAMGLLGIVLLRLHGVGRLVGQVRCGCLVLPALAISLGSLAAGLADFETIYVLRHYRLLIMPLPDALAMTALAMAVWSVCRPAGTTRGAVAAVDQGKEILVTGTLLLLLVGISVAVLAAVNFTSYTKTQLAGRLSGLATHRADMFDTLLESAIGSMREMMDRDKVQQALTALRDSEEDPAKAGAAMAVLIRHSTSLLSQDFSGVRYYRPDGFLLYEAGRDIGNSALRIPLASMVGLELVWQDGFLLRRKVGLYDAAGRYLGAYEAERHIPRLTMAYFEKPPLASSYDTFICGHTDAGPVGCFPTLITQKNLVLAPLDSRQKLPIDFALERQSGLRTAIDYRNRHVTAAHAPVGQRGLGIVVKIDTHELYAPIRNLISETLFAICGLMLACVLILRARIRPLVEQIVISRDAAKAATQLALEREVSVRAVVDHVTDGIVTIDQDGIIQSINNAGAKIFGRSTEALVTRHFTVLMPERHAQAAIDFFDAHNRLPQPDAAGKQTTVMTGLHASGREIFLELRTNQISLHDGLLFIGIIHDVTDAYATQKALRKSEENLRNITDNLPAFVAYVNRNEQYEFINRSYEAWTGKSKEQLAGMTIRELFGEGYPMLAPHIRKVLAGEIVTFEIEGIAPSYPAHAKVSYLPKRDRAGLVEGFYVLSVDTTDQKILSATLEKERELLQAILETIDVGVVACDQRGSLTLVNSATRRFLDIPVDDVPPAQRSTHYRLYRADGVTPLKPDEVPLMRALHGEPLAGVEITIAPADAPVRKISVSGRQLSTKDGELLGAVVAMSDITAFKSVEDELRKLARHDTLTELPNRNRFGEKLDEAILRHERTGQPLSLMFLDIDRFKSINDTYGHAAGDLVLQEFAKRLRGIVRKTDTVARLGGDEFVILLEGTGVPGETEVVAQKILEAMEVGIDIGSTVLFASTSIGIAVGTEKHISAQRFLKQADEALYQAKAAGRSAFRVYRPAPLVTSG